MFQDYRARLARLGEQQFEYEHAVLNLIASDNASPRHIISSDLYRGSMIQEGLLFDRPFAGATLHDEVESTAAAIACAVFQAEHCNLQPHSCSQANQAAYMALLNPGDTVLSLNFKAGGHLTHGFKGNFSGRFYAFHHYGTDLATEELDYDAIHQEARRLNPKLIICGSSSYPRQFDAERLRAICDDVGAYLMLDISHEAGLIASGVYPNPVPYADVATMSLDKTLRGKHSGVILSRQEHAQKVDKAVHPGVQSSFGIVKLFDGAAALLDTQSEDFKAYVHRTLDIAQVIAKTFNTLCGDGLVSGGTDKHMVIVKVQQLFGLSGLEAERRLEFLGILTNRQVLPHDKSAMMSKAGGLRLGSAWAASRGYTAMEFEPITRLMIAALQRTAQDHELTDLKAQVHSIIQQPRPLDVWLHDVRARPELTTTV